MFTLGMSGAAGTLIGALVLERPFSWPLALFSWGLMMGNLPEIVLSQRRSDGDNGPRL